MATLWEASSAMREASPVIIVGEARSGSSVLYRTLQRHSAFRPRRESFVETWMWPHVERTLLFTRNRPRPWLEFMLDDQEVWGDFLRSVRVARLTTALLGPLDAALGHRVPGLWRGSLAPLVLRSFFYHATLARGCARLVEKTPGNVRHLPELAAAFPRSRLLYIHRHPVDVYSSYRRRAAVDPASASWAGIDVETFCRKWTKSTRTALDWAAEHGNLLLVPYESFVRDPEATFRRVCDFVGEPFEVEALLDAPAPRPEALPPGSNLGRPIVTATKRWQDYLPLADAERLQELTLPTMRRLGYEPYTLAR